MPFTKSAIITLVAVLIAIAAIFGFALSYVLFFCIWFGANEYFTSRQALIEEVKERQDMKLIIRCLLYLLLPVLVYCGFFFFFSDLASNSENVKKAFVSYSASHHVFYDIAKFIAPVVQVHSDAIREGDIIRYHTLLHVYSVSFLFYIGALIAFFTSIGNWTVQAYRTEIRKINYVFSSFSAVIILSLWVLFAYVTFTFLNSEKLIGTSHRAGYDVVLNDRFYHRIFWMLISSYLFFVYFAALFGGYLIDIIHRLKSRRVS